MRFLCPLVLLCSACGVSWELYNSRTTELDRCQNDLTRAQSDVQAARQRSEEATQEKSKLHDEVSRLRTDHERLALQCRANLSATEKEMNDLRRVHAQSEQRADLYRKLVERLRPLVDAHSATVQLRKGKLVILMGDQLLFDPGRAELKSSGEAALREIAGALKDIPDRDFLVAGHTDNNRVKSSPFTSNWELSASRAVSVVRFLQAEGVDPRHLAAAGYSEFDALADNAIPENRSSNRRIELMVMPNEEELPPIDVQPAPAVAPTAPATAPPPPPAPPQP